MALMQVLYDTYEHLTESGERELLKIAQSTQNAHIEVSLDKDGKFQRACFVEKGLIRDKDTCNRRFGKSKFWGGTAPII